MKPFNKIIVLENDEERQGLPDSMQYIIDDNPNIPHEVWWWFGEDVRQNPEKSIAKFKELAPDSLFVSQPSFVGYGNTFQGKLHLFKMLMKMGIKISLCIAYYPDFYWYLIRWVGETRLKSERTALFADLKECLEFHEIYYANPTDLLVTDDKMLSLFVPLTWDGLMKSYFQKGDKVRIKATGEEKELVYVYLSDEPERCSFVVDDGIKDEDRRRLNKPNVELKLSDIEKI